MHTKLKDVFRGKVVNKAYTINTGVDEFPRYVLEYLHAGQLRVPTGDGVIG